MHENEEKGKWHAHFSWSLSRTNFSGPYSLFEKKCLCETRGRGWGAASFIILWCSKRSSGKNNSDASLFIPRVFFSPWFFCSSRSLARLFQHPIYRKRVAAKIDLHFGECLAARDSSAILGLTLDWSWSSADSELEQEHPQYQVECRGTHFFTSNPMPRLVSRIEDNRNSAREEKKGEIIKIDASWVAGFGEAIEKTNNDVRSVYSAGSGAGRGSNKMG